MGMIYLTIILIINNLSYQGLYDKLFILLILNSLFFNDINIIKK
jgi:glycogen synthase